MVVVFGSIFYAAACGDYSTRSIAPAGDARSKGVKFSVIAYNVRYFSYGIAKVTRTINDIDADVTLLSETTLTPDQAKIFASQLKGKYLYITRPDETAIISRYPALKFKEILLPGHQASLSEGNDIDVVEKSPHRSFSHAVVDVHGIAIHLFSVRLIAGRTGLSQISARSLDLCI